MDWASPEISRGLWSLAAFLGIVTATVGVASVAAVLRHSLTKEHNRARNARVEAKLFYDRVRYLCAGPIAEFVIIFATIAFVVCVFWGLLAWNGGR